MSVRSPDELARDVRKEIESANRLISTLSSSQCDGCARLSAAFLQLVEHMVMNQNDMKELRMERDEMQHAAFNMLRRMFPAEVRRYNDRVGDAHGVETLPAHVLGDLAAQWARESRDIHYQHGVKAGQAELEANVSELERLSQKLTELQRVVERYEMARHTAKPGTVGLKISDLEALLSGTQDLFGLMVTSAERAGGAAVWELDGRRLSLTLTDTSNPKHQPLGRDKDPVEAGTSRPKTKTQPVATDMDRDAIASAAKSPQPLKPSDEQPVDVPGPISSGEVSRPRAVGRPDGRALDEERTSVVVRTQVRGGFRVDGDARMAVTTMARHSTGTVAILNTQSATSRVTHIEDQVNNDTGGGLQSDRLTREPAQSDFDDKASIASTSTTTDTSIAVPLQQQVSPPSTGHVTAGPAEGQNADREGGAVNGDTPPRGAQTETTEGESTAKAQRPERKPDPENKPPRAPVQQQPNSPSAAPGARKQPVQTVGDTPSRRSPEPHPTNKRQLQAGTIPSGSSRDTAQARGSATDAKSEGRPTANAESVAKESSRAQPDLPQSVIKGTAPSDFWNAGTFEQFVQSMPAPVTGTDLALRLLVQDGAWTLTRLANLCAQVGVDVQRVCAAIEVERLATSVNFGEGDILYWPGVSLRATWTERSGGPLEATRQSAWLMLSERTRSLERKQIISNGLGPFITAGWGFTSLAAVLDDCLWLVLNNEESKTTIYQSGLLGIAFAEQVGPPPATFNLDDFNVVWVVGSPSLSGVQDFPSGRKSSTDLWLGVLDASWNPDSWSPLRREAKTGVR